MFEKNASYLYVANVARGTDTLADMAAGSMAVVNEAGTVQTSTIMATDANFRIVQKLSDGQLIFSPFFNPTKATNTAGTSAVAPTRQVSFLGYNGTSGSLDVAAASDYTVHVEWMNTAGMYNNSPLLLSGAYHTTAASQKELAFGLLDSLNGVLNRQAFKFVNVDVIGDGTVATMTGDSTMCKVTKGSKSVAVYIKATAATVATTASTATVTDGTVFNIPSAGGRTFTFTALDAVSHAAYIGGESYFIADQATAADGSDNATALAALINAGNVATAAVSTAAVTVTYNPDFYALPPVVLSDVDGTPTEVAVTIASGDTAPMKYSIDGTTSAAATFTLDQPYTGETAYIIDGTTAATNSGIATVTNYGLKFSARENSTFDAINDTYSLTRFNITSGDFATGDISYTIKSNDGSGYYKQIANMEIYSQFLDKSPFISAMPRNNYRQETSSSYIYDLVTFDFSEAVSTSIGGITYSKQFRIQIATNSSLDGDGIDACFGFTL